MDEALTKRILAVTRDQLLSDGYSGLKIDRVIRAAGCGKSALYRRYPTKADLVVSAMLEVVDLGEAPDTGSAVEDLLIHAMHNHDLQARNDNRMIALVLFDPEVFPLAWDRWLSLRHRSAQSILQRAIARGELPDDAAIDVIIDTVAGLTLYRSSAKAQPVTEQHYRGVIEALLAHPPRTTRA